MCKLHSCCLGPCLFESVWALRRPHPQLSCIIRGLSPLASGSSSVIQGTPGLVSPGRSFPALYLRDEGRQNAKLMIPAPIHAALVAPAVPVHHPEAIGRTKVTVGGKGLFPPQFLDRGTTRSGGQFTLLDISKCRAAGN